MILKTTPEERARLRHRAENEYDPVEVNGTQISDAIDDIDTLLAEVARLRAGLGYVRRLERRFEPTVARACHIMAAIDGVLGPLETK